MGNKLPHRVLFRIEVSTPFFLPRVFLEKPIQDFFFSKKKVRSVEVMTIRTIKTFQYFCFFKNRNIKNVLIDASNFEKSFLILKNRSIYSVLFFLYKSFNKRGRLIYTIKIINRSLEKTLSLVFNNYTYAYFLDFFFLGKDNKNLDESSILFSFKFKDYYYKDIILNTEFSKSTDYTVKLKNIVKEPNLKFDSMHINDNEFFLNMFCKYYNFFLLSKR